MGILSGSYHHQRSQHTSESVWKIYSHIPNWKHSNPISREVADLVLLHWLLKAPLLSILNNFYLRRNIQIPQ